MTLSLVVGARASPLSQAQVQEVLLALQREHPQMSFEPHFLLSRGDKALSISLRTLEKTDFFTAEIDALLLAGGCRIAIHSAKDLPEPLSTGIQLVALTRGIDARDALVLRPGERLETLPPGAVIATSSERREAAMRSLRNDLHFIDIRGTINQRLAKLTTGEADGVVIAEAALIRLHLTTLNRLFLPGATVPLQGQLAILARQGDHEMETLFRCLDSRKRTLYLGLDPPASQIDSLIIHYPLIKIVPRPPTTLEIQNAFRELPSYTHFFFTSKSAVRLFCDYLSHFGYAIADARDKCIVAVGRATAACLTQKGLLPTLVAQEETAEGLIDALVEEPFTKAYCFWPHSSRARPMLSHFLQSQQIAFHACALYDTEPHLVHPLPDLSTVDEIYFTSPSTVDAFLKAYGQFPLSKTLTAIGPVTAAYIHSTSLKRDGKCGRYEME